MGWIAMLPRGLRQALLCQCLLVCRVERMIADENVHLALRACYDQCPGLETFLTSLNEIPGISDFNQADICLTFQGGFVQNKCVTDAAGVCNMYAADITQRRESCLEIGVDITSAPDNTTYMPLTCTMCVSSEGALGKRPYYQNPTLAECEGHCHSNELCETFDYNRLRKVCRTYEACPPTSQSTRHGCEWTVYQKPGFVRPTRAPVESGSSTTSEDSSLSSTSSALKFSNRQDDLGNKAVSSATSTLRPSSRGQAFLMSAVIVASMIIHRWLH